MDMALKYLFFASSKNSLQRTHIILADVYVVSVAVLCDAVTAVAAAAEAK